MLAALAIAFMAFTLSLLTSMFPAQSGMQMSGDVNRAAAQEQLVEHQAKGLIYAHEAAIAYVQAHPGFTGAVPLTSQQTPLDVSFNGINATASATGVCSWQSATQPLSGIAVAGIANQLLGGDSVWTGYSVAGTYINVSFPQGLKTNPCTDFGLPTDGVPRAVRYSPL